MGVFSEHSVFDQHYTTELSYSRHSVYSCVCVYVYTFITLAMLIGSDFEVIFISCRIHVEP